MKQMRNSKKKEKDGNDENNVQRINHDSKPKKTANHINHPIIYMRTNKFKRIVPSFAITV